MRDVSQVIVRGVVAVSVVMMLAIPAEAAPRGGRWFERRVDPVVKILRKMFGVRSEGDMLVDPRP